MPTKFAQALSHVIATTPTESNVLDQVTIQSPEELLSLLWNFPSLASRGLVNAAKLSAYAAPQAASFLAVAANEGLTPGQPRTFALGAGMPPDTSVKLGAAQETLPRVTAAAAAAPQTIDKRANMVWPVRDQGQRGTCVAHAVTALREHLVFQQTGVVPDLSEQFLFWATKTRTADPQPTADGTWIRFAIDALKNDGICPEADWLYNGTPLMGNVTQAAPPNVPSAAAIANAIPNRVVAKTFASGVAGRGASQVLTELTSCRPVAISLPVFADPLRPSGHNWNTPAGVLYGRVFDPPPTSVVIGGHAVCVTGFVPDAEEPSGGYFVIRNSWDRTWGTRLPTAGYHGPEVGYGQVSATYINNYLWELARL
jgi:C1A family cysteine protease